MKKGDNHKMMDPRMGMIAKQNAVVPGGPQNFNPINVTANSDGQQVQAKSIYNDFDQNYAQMGTGMVNPEGVTPSDLLKTQGQNFVAMRGNNQGAAYGLQQQPNTMGSSPNTDLMESMRLAQYPKTAGLPGNAMGIAGMPAIPGSLPSDMPGTTGQPLMQGYPSAEMIPGSTPTKIGKKKGKKVMAATSTNKQPLLVDHILHYAVNLDTAINGDLDVTGTNTAVLLVDSTSADGAIIEDIYTIARGSVAHKVNLYLSSANDYLRPNQATYVGSVTSATTKGNTVRWEEMPKTLAPVPQVGTEAFNRALYVPKGRSLWAARESTANVTDAPILGCQGGWF